MVTVGSCSRPIQPPPLNPNRVVESSIRPLAVDPVRLERVKADRADSDSERTAPSGNVSSGKPGNHHRLIGVTLLYDILCVVNRVVVHLLSP